jgi:hypothetical protein
VRLCMFHPLDHPMERGWVGRIEDEHVIHLAAQTLQSYFTGGGAAREHAVYPLAGVRLLAPVLHPPAIRVFDDQATFWFANPAAVAGPDARIASDERPLALLPRLAAVLGGAGRIGGFTLLAEWRRPHAAPPKDRDFAFGLGPVVVTPDEHEARPTAAVRVDGDERGLLTTPAFDWNDARDLAASGTALRPGDLLAGPAWALVDPVPPTSEVELEVDVMGTLRQDVR